MRDLLMIGAAAAVIVACTAPVEEASSPEAGSAAAASLGTVNVTSGVETRVAVTTSRDDWGEFGLDLASMDTSTHPGDDFFRYVHGTWYDAFEMPADRTR